MNRRPGGGPKRRIRTMYRVIGNTMLVTRNRSIKQLPANWRELLVDAVVATCEHPPKHFYHFSAPPDVRHIKQPYAMIAPGSLPAAPVLFTLDLQPEVARLQRRALDWSLSRCDVNAWPVPKPKEHKGKGGELFINTGLYLHDRLVGDNRHAFNPFRLEGVPGINWRHLEQYTAHKGKAEFLGVKTTCGEPCSCRRTLAELWPLGWEMHY
ncbi:MAG: hypothetical protein ABIS24_00820 [Candidatus Saccharimonadales bacterium]